MLGKIITITLALSLLSGCGFNSFYFRGDDPGDVYTNTVVGYYDYSGNYRDPDTPVEFYFGPIQGSNQIRKYRQ